MNAISVGYRFSRDELSTLLQAMRIDGLPGAPLVPVDKETARRVLDRLASEGLAMVAGDTLYIDKLIGFLLNACAQSRSAVAITDKARTDVLWQSDKLMILGDFAPDGECALTPLQDVYAAQATLYDALLRMNRPLWVMNVFTPDQRFSISPDSSHSEKRIVADAMELLKA